MLNAIKQFFEQHISVEPELDNEHRLKLATAALLIEMMHQDGKNKDEEVVAVKLLLQDKFTLSEAETHELFSLATEQARQAVDLFQFTSLIHRHFSMPQKIRIIENLWTIAYADKHLDAHEEHLVRRVADLLYVSHKDLMQTKHKVLNALNTGLR